MWVSLKIELAGAFVVFLVEGAAGDEDANGHGKEKLKSGKVKI